MNNKEVLFAKRSKLEYESVLGPKLLLLAEKPLPTDKLEIFDSPQGLEYLSYVFKSVFKSAETHVTYIKEENIPFSRNILFNILGRYVWKNTIDPKKLFIGFIGQSAFDAFIEDYKESTDTEYIGLYVNREYSFIKISAYWLSKEPVLIPYVILPNIEEDLSTIPDILNKISLEKKIDIISPYCDTCQIISKLQFILQLYKEKDISYFTFSAKANFITKKIEYFTVYDEFTKKELMYCPTDDLCKNDSLELKQDFFNVLTEVLKTVPVKGNNIENIIQLFPFKDQIKIINDSEISNIVDTYKSFVITGNEKGSEPSSWYKKWYNEVFLPDLKPNMSSSQIKAEGYTPNKYEWIYDIEVFKEDWLFVAKTFDGKNKLICWNDSDRLRDWIKDKILIGFNNAAYDDVVIRHAIGLPFFVENSLTVKEYSDNLIMHDAAPEYPTFKKGFSSKNIPNFLSWDISFHGPFDIRRNSLKKLTMSVLNKRNYDSNVSFDINRKLTTNERLDVEKYCEMDVDNTLALFKQDPDDPKRTFANESYDIRWNMIIEYKMKAKTLINKSSSFAGKLLCGEEAKPDINNTYKIVDGKKQYYSIPELAYKELAGTPILQFYIDNQNNPDYLKENFEYYMGGDDEGHKYQFGFGGLHQALLNYSSKNLVNMDVASLYPSLLVQYGLMSRGAHKNPGSYTDVYHTRLAAKKEGKKLLNEGLKLILNGAIGAMLSQFNPLYDTWANSSICVHGQLLLFILAQRLYNAGFNIVQTNTDGIMIERQENVDYMPICEEWQKQVRLTLEFDEIDILQQNNVNNYYCKFSNGKVKSKGFYLSNEKFGKATSKILCNMVTERPLLEGVEPRDFVIFKKHSIGEIYDGKTRQKLEGRSLAFVVGFDWDPRTQSYYSRSKNTRLITKKDENGKVVLDENGNEIKETVNTESKITGFTEHMLLVDDINELSLSEINTSAYIAFAKNLLNQVEDFGPYFNENFVKVDEPAMFQAVNAFKDNTILNPRNNNAVCQNFLFECDYLSKEEQEELIDRVKDKLYRVVWSGSRSYHCIVRLSKPVTVTSYKRIWYHLRDILGFIGADEQCSIPSKYTRVPNKINEKTGNLQTLYLFDKNILDTQEILDELPRLKDNSNICKEYTGEVSIKALERHIKRLNWDEGNRFIAVQKLSPKLISQVDIKTLLEMIPVKLDRDHIRVIRSKYAYYEKYKVEKGKSLAFESEI